ncbi:MAG: ATPase, T2SS/T4P/T4SS family [Phycisphaerales bacterium]|nr:ATPase, T2SS/T4P/T4SS family [Phycisphaerales bacterium]
MTELAQTSVFLLSPWKPVLIWATFLGWAWLVGNHIDSDARVLRLNPVKWNFINLGAGIVGFGVMLFAGIFYISWVAGTAVLLVPILVYWRIRNAEVPESRKFKLFAKGEGQAEKKKRRQRSKGATLVFHGAGGEVPVPDQEDPLQEAYLQLDGLLSLAFLQGASRIDLALGAKGLASGVTVHSVRTAQEPLPADEGASIVNMIKQIAGMDLADTRRAQYGRFTVSTPTDRHVLTVTVTGSSKGQFVRVDIDEEARIVMPIDALGLLPRQRERLDAFLSPQNRHGIVLLTAPKGQGLSTTAISLLGQHDAYTSNLKILERKTLKQLEGVDHVLWDPSNPNLDFATSLQSILRRDPDVVVTEAIDAETVQTACRAGRDGVLQYLVFNADSAAAAIRTWCQLSGDVDLATKPLRAVVCQRLVRVLCPDCKQPYTPAEPGKLGFPDGTTLYKASGQVQVRNRVEECPTCNGTGYTGVTGLFEVFPVDEECREILAAGDLKAAMVHARRKKMLLLQEVGLQRAAAGITSVEEVSRVLGGGGRSRSAATPATKA